LAKTKISAEIGDSKVIEDSPIANKTNEFKQKSDFWVESN
jgi:hypothetical protein